MKRHQQIKAGPRVTQPDITWQIKREVDAAVQTLSQGDALGALTQLQATLGKTPTQFQGYDLIVHNLLVALKQHIERLLDAADVTPVNPFLRDALALGLHGPMAHDPGLRAAFADTYLNLGQVLFDRYQIGAALACTRKAIAIQPNPTYHVNLTNAVAILKTPAQLADYTTAVTPDQLGRHLFIACLPKTGSTFLKNVLLNLTGYRDLFAVHAAGQNEHDLYLPSLVAYAGAHTVTQQHSRASEANLQLMQAFGIRPIILVRNVFDAVMSLLDFYRQSEGFNTYFRIDFARLDEATQIDLIIEHVIPWCIQFVASWQVAEAEGRLDVHWLSYEAMIADKPAAIERVLAFYGLGASRADIERVIVGTEAEGRKNRFNRGIAGRGQRGLTPQQKERIQQLTRYYPTISFTCIGL